MSYIYSFFCTNFVAKYVNFENKNVMNGIKCRKRKTFDWKLSLFCLLFTAPQLMLANNDPLPADVAQLADSLKRKFAPDSRVALFDVDYTLSGKNVMLRGVTTSTEGHKELLQGLEGLGYRVMDCLQLLPDEEELHGETRAVVNVSVCNLRTMPDFSAEMTTQALMGMPVRVLQRDGWYRVQTPDNYIAWVHPVGIRLMTNKELAVWNRADKVIVTEHFGFVYSQPDRTSQPVSDVVAGNRLKLEGTRGGFYRVSYPDGRIGYLEKRMAMPEAKWREALKQDAASIIHTAYSLMGIPYLWAGTSSKGADCSGFMRTILFLHDIIIPRDASQQAYTGEHIDIASDFGNMQPGDLIFFGRKATSERKERVVHVGMYIGNKRFIHSQGDVHVSSFDSEDPLYDEYNLGRLLFAARVLPYINRMPQLNTTATNPYYSKEGLGGR